MNTNLTLQLDEQLIRFGTDWAQQQGKTLSQLIADYLIAVKKLSEPTTTMLPPITASLKGIARTATIDEDDYHRYIEIKYQ